MMRNKIRRWMFVFWMSFLLIELILCKEENVVDASTSSAHNNNNNGQSITVDNTKPINNKPFSPRMNYDQWKPLGRGDPLKNDPTYDYVPPVLDRVQYWIESKKSPPPTQKTDILLLGVSSKKPSSSPIISGATTTTTPANDNNDSFMKFVDGPKFTNNNNPHQRIARPNFGTTYFPSFLFAAKNKLTSMFSDGGAAANRLIQQPQQRIPYTMLMPPPIVPATATAPTQLVTTKKPTLITAAAAPLTYQTSSVLPPLPAPDEDNNVTIQTANLIYQSSSVINNKEWQQHASSTIPTNNLNENKNFVFQQKQLPPPPQSYMQIEFASPNTPDTKPLIASNSDHNINYVTPPPLPVSVIKHKGQVLSDDNIDISNAYVNIGKPEAQVDDGIILPSLYHRPSTPSPIINFNINKNNMMVYSSHHVVKHPLTMQTIENMQTMQPPPPTISPVYNNSILHALEKEKVEETTTQVPPSTITETTIITTAALTNQSDDDDLTTTNNNMWTMTTILSPSQKQLKSATTTTTSSLMTTDPLFRHYKQPVEPIISRGPLYLIIQGHSKVKTYGPSKQIHGISVKNQRHRETNEITDDDEFNKIVKHLHSNGDGEGRNKDERVEALRKGRSGNDDLQTLKHVVQTGLGSISELKDDVKETNLEIGYKVANDAAVTSETYHKGIVEEARKLKSFD